MINEIICEDAIRAMKKLESESIDLIITSPPYFQQREYITEKDLFLQEIGRGSIWDYLDTLQAVFKECVRVCKYSGNIVFNIGDKYIDGDLQLIPYQFAMRVLDHNRCNGIKLVNEITWVKTNPTPRQYKRRLISSTEPFFHFVKSNDYYYDRDEFLKNDGTVDPGWTPKKGEGYGMKISQSDLTPTEQLNAYTALLRVKQELQDGKITDFRMKIRGIHKKAFGGQAGGRNNQIEKQGFTVIRMYGNRLKRDIIESAVANSKNIDHPAIFPLKVIKELVQLLSPEGSVVLDPFCGSGQTCIAAKDLNRSYIGIDLKEEYCNIARQRLKNDSNN